MFTILLCLAVGIQLTQGVVCRCKHCQKLLVDRCRDILTRGGNTSNSDHINKVHEAVTELTGRLIGGLTGAATLKQLREGVTHCFNVRFRHVRAGSRALTLTGATTLSTARLLTTTGLIVIARLVGATGLLDSLTLSYLASLSLSFLSYLSRFGRFNLISCKLYRLTGCGLGGRLFCLLFLVDDKAQGYAHAQASKAQVQAESRQR